MIAVTPGEIISASSMTIDEDDRHELDYIRIECAGIACQKSDQNTSIIIGSHPFLAAPHPSQ